MHAVAHALSITWSMTWQIAWALILGFFLSAVVQAVVRRSTIVRMLGDDRPRTLALAAAVGTASSSCSYAAVALARSLLREGASFAGAMAFEIASTNLVIELGVILALLMGLAVHAGRVRRRPGHDRGGGRRLPAVPAGQAGAGRPAAGRPRPGRLDGGPHSDGHVHPGRRLVRAAAAVPGRVHRGVERVRDGVGRDPA